MDLQSLFQAISFVIVWCIGVGWILARFRTRFHKRLPLRLTGVEVTIIVAVTLLSQTLWVGMEHTLYPSPPFSVGVSDISDWPAFSRTVSEAEVGATPEYRFWKLLDPTQRKTIETIAQQGEATTEQLQEAAKAVDAVLQLREFYEPDAYGSIAISEHFRKVLDEDLQSLSDEQILRFNRLLFEASFPQLVRRSLRRVFGSHALMSITVMVILLVTIRYGFGYPLRQVGFHRGHIGTFLLYGVIQAAFWTPPTLLLSLTVQILMPPESIHVAQNFFVLKQQTIDWLLIAVNVSVMAPLIEELFFRGILHAWLSRRGPTWVALLFSSTLFGLAHSTSWPDPVPLTFLGVGLAVTYHMTRSLWSCISFHAAFNSMSLLIGWLNL